MCDPENGFAVRFGLCNFLSYRQRKASVFFILVSTIESALVHRLRSELSHEPEVKNYHQAIHDETHLCVDCGFADV